MSDLVDTLVGIAPGSPLDAIRRSRDIARTNIEAADAALFKQGTDEVGLRERLLVAAFATALTVPGSALAGHRLAALAASDAALVRGLVASAEGAGPWGTYREPGLAHESDAREWWSVPATERAALGEPLVAVLEHAHFLLLHPRDARPEVLQRLVDAGWSRAAIVTWSQLVSFVAFQTRLVAGLAVLAATAAAPGKDAA